MCDESPLYIVHIVEALSDYFSYLSGLQYSNSISIRLNVLSISVPPRLSCIRRLISFSLIGNCTAAFRNIINLKKIMAF